ncbi:RNA recognition domain-containing protein [Coniochaeta sp. 2T2.1]|nr:RNA recognition domain-containing protein [Coniochaeta sp. 2T2.1]
MESEESSRIFVKNLPPNINEADFRKHFSSKGREITDIRLIPKRRIGYVGYKTPEDAAKAVKYFNRSYIRMSRIAVEIARPIIDPELPTARKVHPASTSTKPAPQAKTPLTPPAEDPSLKKRKRDDVDESDPKLREFLEVMDPKHAAKRQREDAIGVSGEIEMAPAPVEDESDGEYEEIPAKGSKDAPKVAPTPKVMAKVAEVPVVVDDDSVPPPQAEPETLSNAPEPEVVKEAPPAGATDDDWLRSRTNRLLDLVDPGDPNFVVRSAAPGVDGAPPQQIPVTGGPTAEEGQPIQDTTVDHTEGPAEPEDGDTPETLIQKTARLFVRNLPYTATEENLRTRFEKFGAIEEVHLPVDSQGKSKGYALVLYEDPSAALAAFQQADGTTLQGRLIHVLPAAQKRENQLDEFAISKLPLKKQNLIRKKAEAASNTFNWNSLYMNQDAVNASVAERLGVSKSELLDPTSADAAVRQAIAETSIIQETKAYFAANGVDLNAFKSHQRGDTAILVKNFPFGTNIEELRKMFEEFGTVLRVLMPPSGTIAIVQFVQPAHAKAAFARLAYRRIENSVLFLEKAPKNIFTDSAVPAPAKDDRPAGVQKVSVTELLERDDGKDQLETASLFVKNLDFKTTTEVLAETFKPLDGFVSARVKTKTDPKKPGQILSMGFGFVEFRSKEQAQDAFKVMDGYVLDGHVLSVKASHKGLDAAEERRREDVAKKVAGQRTKIVVKNLPFEATKKDIRVLFGTYGTLRSVRVPKKFNSTSRGFAFAEFTTPREAENALNALKDTHLLGRKLVLDFAEAEAIDAEEEIAKMQKKIGGQVNKVSLQQLTGRGRQRVNIGETGDEDDA